MSLLKFRIFTALLLVLSHDTDIAVQAGPSRVARAPVDKLVTLPIKKHLNFTGPGTMLQHGQARARSLRERAIARPTGVPPSSSEVGGVTIENQILGYSAYVNIGTPPTGYALVVDTGSANTWVGANQPYVVTSSTETTANDVVSYSNGPWMFGTEYTDTVELGPGLSVRGQSIGVALYSEGFAPYDGILGLGPTALSIGTLTPENSLRVPTVTDNLVAQGVTGQNMVSIFFEPATEGPIGELTFGGVDPTKFVNEVYYAPITTQFPSSEYYGVDQAVYYGDQLETLLVNNPGILDTATSLVLLATDAFTKYVAAVGAVFDETVGLYRITLAQYSNLQSLFFLVGDAVLCEFTANAQIWPRQLNYAIGGSDQYAYLLVGDIGHVSGSGMDIILGMPFIERFYTVFDYTHGVVGVGYTEYTDNEGN
ncbi:aspartic peptidase A1 [Cubamyces menziesii]|nr:aspartic peptidase A1 [Cubamyces menziesii]